MHRQELLDKLKEIDGSDYAKSHYDRFIESYYFIEPYLKDGMKCLDLGSYGHFRKLVQAFNPGVEFPQEQEFDLRNPFPIESEKYHFVFCMEVIEHIKDQNENGDIDRLAEFNQSGVNNIMSEIYRIMKPQGLLFLTTPNIGSYMSIHRALSYYSPTFYLPHVKEWSIQEMHELHARHGLARLKVETRDVFGEMSCAHPKNLNIVNKIDRMCRNVGYGTHLRGDVMMFLSLK